jgi:hypothetical protein
VGLSACNVRFHADFETDTPGSPPALHPAGPPDDEIVISDTNVAGDGILIRVTEEPHLVPAGRPHRFMSLIYDPNPGLSSVAVLRSAPLGTGTQPIFAQWDQVLDGGGTGVITFAGDPEDPPRVGETCRVFTNNDLITLECGRAQQAIRGIDTHAIHTVLLRFDRSPHRAVLQVAQGGVLTQLITIQSADVVAPVEGQRLLAQIEYVGQSGGAYRFNRFDIQERDPN